MAECSGDPLAQALCALGCPREKAPFMAEQLDKRAVQLSARTGRSYEQALEHLLNLMRQGWAAQSPGPPNPSSTS